jgi:hypothetical protein
MRWRIGGELLLLVSLVGCSWAEDDAKSATGPGVVIHCDALTRNAEPHGIGDTTVKAVCPGGVEGTVP